MSLDHPIHSRPSAEILATGVTPEQVDSFHNMSNVMFGNPDRLLEVLGTPTSRGDAGLMLGAVHAYRSKSKPMPGRQKEYFELIRAALEEKHRPVEQEIERECTECGYVKPLSEFSAGRRQCKPCVREIAQVRKAATRPMPTKEEEKPMDTTPQTKTCSRCGEDKPVDEFGKDKNAPDGKNYRCKLCVRELSRARNKKQKKSSGSASPQQAPDETGTSAGDADDGSSSVRESAPPLAASPPLSSQNGWAVLSDPRLSDLRKLQDLLLDQLEIDVVEVTLEDTAKVATAIAETFGPKGSDDS